MRYDTRITQQKQNQNKSRSSRSNNSMSKNEKKTIFKQDPKKDRT